ncbi:hypothetical protein [Arundinibacter roseus]|uniref:Uncharacterized protein n=1 Tax=Arundinibacter roseus TaxID=2070510 RepID=A0A4R4K0W0_9BACT|nr:hypothetical protein [Arundinibacter roseus]TDB60870.1 hypothetical protein EZE20_20725 [Arundinibacter roseus]
MFVPVPIKSSTTLYALIFDSQKNAVVYFSRTIPVEQSPTDAHVLRSQFAKLFTHKKYLKR